MLASFATTLHIIGLFATTTVQSYICQPPMSATITDPTDSSIVTSAVAFTVSGTGTPSSDVTVFDDNNSVADVTVDQTGHFAASVTVDTAGNHTIHVTTSNPCGSASGSSITIIANNPPQPVVTPTPTSSSPSSLPSPPPTSPLPPDITTTTSDDQATSQGLTLSVRSPKNNTTVSDASLFVSGATSQPAIETISVNGTVVGTTNIPQLAFGMTVPLELGKNTVLITAKDGDRTASVSLIITRQNPTPVQPWYKTPTGKTIIAVTTISVVSIIFIIFIIGLFFL